MFYPLMGFSSILQIISLPSRHEQHWIEGGLNAIQVKKELQFFFNLV
jgi:hypothetical protein